MVLAKRHVADGEVEEAGAVRRLEARDGDVRFRVKLLGDSPGDAVQLHAVELAVCHVFRQQAEEVADAHRRLKDAPALEAHAAHGLIDGSDDRGRGVVRVERRAPRRLVFFRREQGFQLLKLALPLALVLVEYLGDAAPADVAGEFILLLGRGLKAVSLKVFEQLDGLDVRPAFRLGSALAEMLVRDAEVPRPPPRLLLELLQRRLLRRRDAREPLPLAVNRNVYHGLGLIRWDSFFGLDRFIGAVFGGGFTQFIQLILRDEAVIIYKPCHALTHFGPAQVNDAFHSTHGDVHRLVRVMSICRSKLVKRHVVDMRRDICFGAQVAVPARERCVYVRVGNAGFWFVRSQELFAPVRRRDDDVMLLAKHFHVFAQLGNGKGKYLFVAILCGLKTQQPGYLGGIVAVGSHYIPVLHRDERVEVFRLDLVVLMFGAQAIRNVPVPLVAPEQALEVCAALGAVDGVGQLRRQQLDVAALEVGYLELPPVEPHEVPDAVGRCRRFARLEHRGALGHLLVRRRQHVVAQAVAELGVVVVELLKAHIRALGSYAPDGGKALVYGVLRVGITHRIHIGAVIRKRLHELLLVLLALGIRDDVARFLRKRESGGRLRVLRFVEKVQL